MKKLYPTFHQHGGEKKIVLKKKKRSSNKQAGDQRVETASCTFNFYEGRRGTSVVGVGKGN